jgi:hypothetical protein
MSKICCAVWRCLIEQFYACVSFNIHVSAADALNCAELSASCEVARNMLLFNPDLLTTKSSPYLNAVVPLFDLIKSLGKSVF